MKFGKLIGLIALLAGLYLLWRIRLVVLLAFAAVAIATVLNRVVRQLLKWRFKRGPAIVVTLISLFALIAVVFAIATPPFVAQARQWLDQVPLEIARISQWIDQLNQWIPVELSDQLRRLDTFIRDIPQLVRSVFDNFLAFFRGTVSFLLNFLLVLVVTIMLLANPRAYRRAFVTLFPQFYRYRVQEILDHCERSLVAWGIGIIFNMLVITLMSFVGLMVIGVPLPIANAFIAGLMTFIPNVGPVISVIPPTLLALLESPWKGLAVLILYIVIQQVESNCLTPLVMKRQVSLLPAATLLSQLIFGLLFGFLGLFLALPMVVIGQVWLQELLVKDIMNQWTEKTSSGPELASHHTYQQ